MNSLKPQDLNEEQWLLLRHLHQYSTPFYTEFLYAQFSKHQIERLLFYKMFFSLAALSYVILNGHGELVTGHKQDFSYVVSSKGKRALAQYTQAQEDNWDIYPVASAVRTNGIIAAYLTTTVRLKDYSLIH